MIKALGSKSWKKTAIFIVLSIIMALLSAILASYFYLQSTHFRKALNKSLIELSGARIELTDQIEIESLYPNIRVSLPNARARLQDFSFGYERIRIRGLKLTLSPSVLFSRTKRGQVIISIENLAAISGNKPNNQNTEETDSTLAAQLRDFLDKIAQMRVMLKISELEYINRDENSVSTHFKGDNIVLEAEQKRLSLMVDKLEYAQNSYALNFSLSNLTWPKESSRRLSGKLMIAGNNEVNNNQHLISSDLEIIGNKLSFTQAEYKNSFLWLRGNTDISLATKPIKVRGKIELRKIELTQKNLGLNSGSSMKSNSENKRFFSEETIDLSNLEWFDIDTGINFGAVRFNNTPILNGNAQLTANKSGLLIVSENLSLLGGQSYFSFDLKRTETEPTLRLKLSADNIQLNRIRLKNENDTLMSKGLADFLISLKSSGKSPANIAASMNGYISMFVSDAEIKQKFASALDAGIVNWGRKKISQLSNGRAEKKSASPKKEKHALPISCASFKGFINNGSMQVSNGAVIVLPQNTLVSSGYINLESEKLAFVFRAKNNSFFNWSAISMIKYMEISGLLSHPTITLNSKALAKQGILSVSSVILGPIPALVYSLAEAGVKNINKIQCVSTID